METDVESQHHEPRPRVARRMNTKTARMISTEIRGLIASSYRHEITSMMRWRDVWKKFGDACEAIAKGLTGISSVLAFASSANPNVKTADVLAFTSGTVGTIGLVLLAYSSYASKESRQRTAELNTILDTIGVTPVPDIATSSTEQ